MYEKPAICSAGDHVQPIVDCAPVAGLSLEAKCATQDIGDAHVQGYCADSLAAGTLAQRDYYTVYEGID